MFKFIVLENGKEKAIFKRELDAMQYRDFLKNINRACGYKDRFEIKEREVS